MRANYSDWRGDRMLKKEALQIAGSLSRPSKMPGRSYSLPMRACKVLGEICEDCYAARGRYSFRPVQAALERRLEAITHPQWVDAMVALISREKVPYFRWHDSGDLQSVEHYRRIIRIARRLPEIRFWLPSRAYHILSQITDVPANLVVRVSAAHIDRPVLIRAPWVTHTSTTHRDRDPIGYACPARRQGNKCGECRACWDRSVPNISYPLH